METIVGVVTRINFYDDNTGFGIVRIKLNYQNPEMAKYRSILFANILSVLATFDREPLIDEEYEFTGDLETSQYGWQLRAHTFSRRNPNSLEGVITYLSSDLFPGIGKKTAQKVYEALGENCLNLIISDEKALDKVDITSQQKAILFENLKLHYEKEHQIMDLLNLGLTMKMANKVANTLGFRAFELVKENPYQLIRIVEGIGFIRADKIALNNGVRKDSPLRLKALIVYVLEEYIYNNGNTYLHLNELYLECLKLANTEENILNKDNYRELIIELANDKQIKIDDKNYVYDVKLYEEEYQLAKKLTSFLESKEAKFSLNDIKAKLEKVMQINKIEYSDKQYEAITKALQEPIIIITGGPGTGKSTIIKGIIDTYAMMFDNEQIIRDQILLCAPTGRASKRLKEVTKHNACTIHKLLGFTGGNKFSVTPDCPLEAKLIIIDEFSMVDTSLACYLFSVLNSDTKVVIVGDADQLPSVGPGNVLRDLIECKEITTIKLDKIHRQASDSSIIALAHDVNHGILPDDFTSLHHDRTFIKCDDSLIIKTIEHTIKECINKGYDLQKDIQILAPIYKSDVGIDAINYHMQDIFNPQYDEITFMGKRFRVNDKVIQLVNRSEKGVMNGDIGFILHINHTEDKINGLSVMFDFGTVDYDKDELEDLSLAYAISIHKSQGSEFPVVIIPFSFRYYNMLKRKLIYTAITRAKQYLIMIGSFEAVRKGIVELEDQRKTNLALRIKEVLNQEESHEPESDDLENISPYDFM